MVKITIKTKDIQMSGSEDSELDSEASEAESTELNVSKTGRSKRKCVVNFEKKKAKTLRPSKSRSKSVTPVEDEEEEQEEVEERPPKQIFSCDVCSKAYHSRFMLRTHLKAHKKVEAGKCDRYYHYYLNTLN